MPKSVFAPYTPIATNVLFFEKDVDGTKNTWFYRMDIPSDRKSFSKTKPIKSEHFQPIRDWWINREEIQDEEGNYKACCYSREEIAKSNYYLDLCGYPHKVEEILEPMDLIDNYQSSQNKFVGHITDLLKELSQSISNPLYSPQNFPTTKLSCVITDIIKLNTSLDNQLRKSVLQYAIQGKLVPQNLDDEPASVLIDRIRAEKARLIVEGKIKRDKNESVIYRTDNGRYIERIGKTETDITEKIPFEIPNSWEWVRGKSVFEAMESTKPSGKQFTYIDIDAVDNITNTIHRPKILPTEKAPSRATRKLHEGDILFSMVRPYLKNIALVEENNKNAIASTGFYVISGTRFYDVKFLLYLLLSPYIVDGLNQFIKGEHSPSINNSHIENFLYPLPPLAEQKRIVERINQIFPLCK